MKTPDPDRLVDLCKPESKSEADIIVAMLKDEGIPAIGPGTVPDPFGGALDVLIPHKVQVKACDLEEARLFLEQRKDEASAIDWDAVEWAAEDDPERVNAELPNSLIDTGLFVRVIAFLMILVLLGFLLTSVLTPGSGNGVVPGSP